MQAYREADTTPFSIPGHKVGRGTRSQAESPGQETFRHDILEMEGFDDRCSSYGVKELAQQLAAKSYGSEKCFFSTGGSTLSAHLAVLTAAGPGEEILVARNSHKSVIAGLILSGAKPIFVRPVMDDKLEIEHGWSADEVERALKAHSKAKAALGLSPTYYGFSPDVKALADVCHKHEKPLIVDEAWGSHFPFHEDMPPSAMSGGADMSYTSLHKTETGLCQGSIIHLQGDRINPTTVENRLELLRSTSESGLILASIDACRRKMATEGQILLDKLCGLARAARAEIKNIEGLKIVGVEELDGSAAATHDFTKLLIDVQELGMTGFFAGDWLRDNCKVTMELCDHRYILAVLTIGDDEITVERLLQSLKQLAKTKPEHPTDKPMRMPKRTELVTECTMTPRDAYFAKQEAVPLEKSAGRIAAEMVCPYPPGIPMLVPGERITEPIIEWLRKGMKLGMYVSDVRDQELKTVQVVA